jgi:hypothetical protein
MDIDITNGRPIEWHNARERFNPPTTQQRVEPAIDKAVSAIVGKPVLTTDPRLIKLVVKWKREKPSEDVFVNYLDDPAHIQELKSVFL